MHESTFAGCLRHPLPELGLFACFVGFVWWLRGLPFIRAYVLPPGPYGLPWIGYTACLGNLDCANGFEEMQKLKVKYGDLVSFTLLGNTVVVLNTSEMVHEAAIKHRPQIGRYTLTTNHWLAQGDGISNYDTPRALELRLAFFRHLYGYEDMINYLGDNGSTSEIRDTVQAETKRLLLSLKNNCGIPTDVLPLARYTVWNIMWKIVFGRSCDLTREQIEHLLDQISTNNTENSMLQLIQLMPKQWLYILDRIPWAMKLLGMDKLNRRYTEVNACLRAQLKSYEQSQDKSPKALLYRLQNDQRLNIQKKELERLLFEMMAAGTDTTSLTLTNACAYMAECNELLTVSGLDKHMDRIHRQASVVPLALPHVVRQPIHMSGYHIPAGSIMIFNLYAIHQTQMREVCPMAAMPFSIGSRACPGQRLANKVLQDIIRAIDQNFSVQIDPVSPPNRTENMRTGEPHARISRGLTLTPTKTVFVFHTR
ncbi:unnamed protein product [Echinostoma caproni]|uniref:Cytochrome P450 n=1 Tax=Echinostoma caproni TaxID=27848 RepID=A0A183ATJ3_9TREM|nr:unnamed protein product [Echinostoma caproni]